jgi:hypothetical protein
MVEEDKVFDNKMKYDGILTFSKFYQFAYDFLRDEIGLLVSEGKYKEKLAGDAKNLEIVWTGVKEVTDYFKFQIKVEFKIIGLTNIELTEDGKKIKTNKGSVEMKVQGILLKDYKSKFEKNGFQKFLRGIYEKAVIYSRIDQMEENLIIECEKFLSQVKAYLDLEGKR